MDPNLQIRVGGGGWGGSSRPCHKGLVQSPKNFFQALVWSNNKGGPALLCPSPGSATVYVNGTLKHVNFQPVKNSSGTL